MVYLQVVGAQKPYTVETTFIQVGQSTQEALELLLLADQGRLDPRALGRGQRPGRHDADHTGDDQLIRSPGQLHPPGPGHRPGRAQRTARDPARPGDDATWFPNLYDDLTWTGPNKEKGGEVTIFQTPSPLLKYDQLFNTSARWLGSGQ